MLKQDHHYEVEIFDIDFRGSKLNYDDRPKDLREKCVDVALASELLYLAAIPGAYDIAMPVIGDGDYVPVLQRVRRLGKRVAIASIVGSCSHFYTDPLGEMRLKDMDIIWLDDNLQHLTLEYEKHQEQCQDPFHQGDRRFYTTYRPRKNEKVYCDECRERNRQARQRLANTAHQRVLATPPVCAPVIHEESSQAEEAMPAAAIIGLVADFDRDGDALYGVVCDSIGRRYDFTDEELPSEVSVDQLTKGCECRFHVLNPPSGKDPGKVRKIISVSVPVRAS